ncbi:peptidoglycan-binding domain-containing protein [Agrobacterium sp. ES01]|uniref:peptidoglycan-binding domain-containing protein n=1 Tax=Agrobacterium sp. ES01 TaxID=3420714 RepID=UPI003D13F3A1
MARKRKSPEPKPAARALRVFTLGAAAFGRLVSRHPVFFGGATCFAIVFGFVAANALWYQPGRHPSPYLRTRDAKDFFALTGVNQNPMLNRDAADVVTYRIAREGDDTKAPGTTPAADELATKAPEQSDAAGLTMAVQRELKRRGLYDGADDGVSGPMTRGAIIAFQKTVGMAETGEASPELLAALRVDSSATAAIPLARPAEDLSKPSAAIDPVAAAIRSAEKTVVTTPAQKNTSMVIPDPESLTEQANLIMEIQRGLSNIAYADVSVDGVAGDQTKAAIRHFERHYRLPETGEPNEAVLKKLKSIGAL